ncbi:hypothetical protein [Pseudoalteromonas sp. Of11M-6]|uniref:hypothetical protein n=1 Tax=Pseudoalteromonas sp. Of11M-6 TaxID=2917754 RepID=UPI001EF733A8|nr:hypothetical protein [Pseudoalteromonas sp. Of11M-6]MCG7551955.1 hypothetical protein [Pseudoalteromonas sp. Of11M-6]
MIYPIHTGEFGFVEINRVGRYFHVLKATQETVVKLIKNGNAVLETRVWQGMSLHNVEYDRIEVVAPSQEIIVWVGNVPFDFKEVSNRPRTLRGEEKIIGNGIQTLLDDDPSRIIARVEMDSEFWLGGEDLKVINGVVQNGRRYKAGQEINIEVFGQVNCWITDDATAPLMTTPKRLGEYEWSYGEELTRSKLMAAGIPYVDVYIPRRMDGIPFSIDVELEAVAPPPRPSYSPRIFITEGEPNTEKLIEYGWVSGGHAMEQGDKKVWEGSSEKPFSWGYHRVFLIDHDSDAVTGAESWLAFNRLSSDNAIFAIGGTAQITTEHN